MPTIAMSAYVAAQAQKAELPENITLVLTTWDDYRDFLSIKIGKKVIALDFSNIKLSEDDVGDLVRALNEQSSIFKLTLSNCQLTDLHEERLGQLKYITDLDLNNNLLQQPGLKAQKLKSLCLNNNPHLDAAVVLLNLSRSVSNLEKLDLVNCNVTDSDLISLVSLSFRMLTFLDLSNNFLSDEGQEFLLQRKNHNPLLQEINLLGNMGIVTLQIFPFASGENHHFNTESFLPRLEQQIKYTREKLEKLSPQPEPEASSSQASSPKMVPINLFKNVTKNAPEQLKVLEKLMDMQSIVVKKLILSRGSLSLDKIDRLQKQIETYHQQFMDAKKAKAVQRQNSPRSASPDVSKGRTRSPSSPRSGSIRNLAKFFDQQQASVGVLESEIVTKLITANQIDFVTKLIAAQEGLINYLKSPDNDDPIEQERTFRSS
ncbi:hypothetical protein [Legionella rowbothamii]|uniref:hypothetical protein n=1 Tax=Legionella rowbothamii TaxID=96229 RepID=UPI00105659EA|nr:hypothetical protein [Legionella rowbothamii]